MKTLSGLWWIWALVYSATGANAMMQGGTGLFASPVDEFESFLFKVVFLNFPLQMLLAITAYALWDENRAVRRALGMWVGVAASILIGVNFVVGCWLALF